MQVQVSFSKNQLRSSLLMMAEQTKIAQKSNNIEVTWLLTLTMNYLRSLLTIALTTRPFTSASQIDIIVRTTRSAANTMI
jgi:hypothetical protein